MNAVASQPVPPNGMISRQPAMGDSRSADPQDPRCHCGRLLISCSGCQSLRCLDCDPYRSDDCVFDF